MKYLFPDSLKVLEKIKANSKLISSQRYEICIVNTKTQRRHTKHEKFYIIQFENARKQNGYVSVEFVSEVTFEFHCERSGVADNGII